jgi:hypothetical protein
MADDLHVRASPRVGFLTSGSMDSAPPPPDPIGAATRFDALVRSLSWDWLEAISRSLHLEVQLVDTQGSSRLPATAPSQSALARFVVSATTEARSLVEAAVSRRAPQTITAHNLRIFAYPLIEGDDLLAVALIARPAPGRRASPLQQSDVDPDVATQSILRGIQAHLHGASPAARPQFDDLASVGHVLDAAAAHGTDRELVSAFAAALAFWKRIDVYGYVTTASGTYAAEVWPPAAAEPQMASMVAVADLPSGGTLTALSSAQIQALGIRNARDVLVARVPEGDFPWLIVFCGTIAPADVSRLGLYVRLLEQLIRTVISESIVKVVTAISAHLLEHADDGETAATGVLDVLNASIGLSSSALTITTGYGAPLLHVGHTEPFPRPTDIAAGSRFATLRRAPNRYTFSLVLTSAEGRRITRHQRDVSEAVTNLLDAWVRRILPQLQQRDRRAASRAFDEVLDRFAAQALERGSVVSVVVLLISDSACFPGLTQQWIARIRGTMRAADIVGMLGEGEIGLLLHDTSRDRAEIVALRILKMLETTEGAYTSPVVATGVASRSPDGPGGAAGIAEEARNDAISRATGFVQQDSQTNPQNDTQ